MSENIIGNMEVMGKNFQINWPYNQNDVGFEPHYADAVQLDELGSINYDNFTLARILPENGTTFTSQDQVFARAERSIIEELALLFIIEPNASRARFKEVSAMIKDWDTQYIRDMLS